MLYRLYYSEKYITGGSPNSSTEFIKQKQTKIPWYYWFFARVLMSKTEESSLNLISTFRRVFFSPANVEETWSNSILISDYFFCCSKIYKKKLIKRKSRKCPRLLSAFCEPFYHSNESNSVKLVLLSFVYVNWLNFQGTALLYFVVSFTKKDCISRAISGLLFYF
jgi:hypothetical protein